MAAQEYIRLYDLRGNLTAILENAYNIVIEEKLGDAETLSFSIPFEDTKAQHIAHDEEIIYTGKRYIITQIVDGRDESGKETIDVTCECCYIELLNTVKCGKFSIDRRSVEFGLSEILQGTNWTVGSIEGNVNGIYSLEETDQSVLWLVRQWAKITGLEIQWNSIDRKVNLLETIGTDRGAVFRYKKNLKSITRTMKPPEATVIYPRGKGDLTIENANNGIDYLEDYSWYVSQGLSLAEARARFKKEYIWSDEQFMLPENLKEAARKKLSELSRPIISYECNILDLARITRLSENKFFLGDTVTVYDSDLKISIKSRILRLKRYPQEPWKDEVELSYIIPGLQDTIQTGQQQEETPLSDTWLEYVNVPYEPMVTIKFNQKYSLPPTVNACILRNKNDYNYGGSFGYYHMTPNIDLIIEGGENGFLYYTGAVITWGGTPPDEIPDGYVSVQAIGRV